MTISHRSHLAIDLAGGFDYSIHALDGVTFRVGNLWVTMVDQDAALTLCAAWRVLMNRATHVDWTDHAACLNQLPSDVAAYIRLCGPQPAPTVTVKTAGASEFQQGEASIILCPVKFTCRDRIALAALDTCWGETYAMAQTLWRLPDPPQIDAGMAARRNRRPPSIRL